MQALQRREDGRVFLVPLRPVLSMSKRRHVALGFFTCRKVKDDTSRLASSHVIFFEVTREVCRREVSRYFLCLVFAPKLLGVIGLCLVFDDHAEPDVENGLIGEVELATVSRCILRAFDERAATHYLVF